MTYNDEDEANKAAASSARGPVKDINLSAAAPMAKANLQRSEGVRYRDRLVTIKYLSSEDSMLKVYFDHGVREWAGVSGERRGGCRQEGE